MQQNRRKRLVSRDIPVILTLAGICTGLLAYWDAYEWFYHHSRKHEAYNYDEIVAFVMLFLVMGLLWTMYRLYQAAKDEIANRQAVEAKLACLNRELENRIDQRTSQLRQQLDERARVEKQLVAQQRKLCALSAEVTLTEEQTRHRIAIDLHDNIGHALALANNRLDMLKMADNTGHRQESLNDISALIRDAIHYSRSLVCELSCPLLYSLSLPTALKWLADETLSGTGITVELKLEQIPDIAADSSRAIFLKTVREALVNIVKHANASRVEIVLTHDEYNLIVKIVDDGVGFEPRDGAGKPDGDMRGFGTLISRERLSQLEGLYQVKSEPDSGTQVVISLPMANTVTRAAS